MQIFGLPQTAATRETSVRREVQTGPTAPTESLGSSEGPSGLMTRMSFAPAAKTGSFFRGLALAVALSVMGGAFAGPALAAGKTQQVEQQQVRPEVRNFLNELKDGTITGVKHTTRGLAFPSPYEPRAPQPFAAGRFQIDFQTKDGQSRAFVVDTESRVGHLGNVVPGQTDVGGSISLLTDPANSQSVGATLTKDEQGAMLASLYAKAGQPMVATTADKTDFAISSVAAVHFSGQGAAAVSQAHQRLSGQ